MNKKQWPVGTKAILVNRNKKYFVPYSNNTFHYTYTLKRLFKPGSRPIAGQEAVITGKCRRRGWYMVEYENKSFPRLGKKVAAVGMHKVHFKRIPNEPLPTVTYHVSTTRIGPGDIKVGSVWVRAVDKRPKK